MRMIEDRIKQAQTEIDAALAKRRRAKKLWEEADEELIIAQIKMEDAINENKIRQGRINANESARNGRWS